MQAVDVSKHMEKIIVFYKNTLGIDLTDLEHPIAKKINSLDSSTEIERKVKKFHLEILGISLMEIMQYDLNIYNYYLKRIVKNKDISINGHIFEINQCAHLLRKSKQNNLEFEFGNPSKEEPDFIINKFGFEITSTRFADNSNKLNPGKKVLAKFREKNCKPYANENCVLIIGISQITHHALKQEQHFTPSFEEVKETVGKESKFGLVIFLMEWIEKTETIHSKTTAYEQYSEKCNIDLKILMQEKFLNESNTFNGEILTTEN